MCGLTGFIDGSGLAPDAMRAVVSAMTQRLAHRGPDAGDVWVEEGVALGHRRLSILDLSPAGAQPMLSACRRHVIVFNGEIYNHVDLRAMLAARRAAPEWRGHSDTETLLAAVAAFGIDEALGLSNGMFALALWDRQTRTLTLARDRMGEKPVYWGWAGRALVFGSELKALAAHPGFAGGVCQGALAQYLRFSHVPAPRSIHPGIYKLEPGTILTVAGAPPPRPPAEPLRPGDSHGSLSIRRYWSLADEWAAGATDPLRDDGAALEELEQTLARAVRRQMLSDVPLGAFLSGGIDSSTIVALMRRETGAPVRTFTVGFDDAAYDESPHAAAVARHLGTDHATLRVTDREARDVIPELPRLYDEPFADSSQIPTHLVCRAARAQVTVALSGDAGDELFGGYNRYLLAPKLWRRMALLPPAVRRMLGAAILGVPHGAWNRMGVLHNRLRPGRGGIALLGDKAHRLARHMETARSSDDLYRSLVSIWEAPSRLLAGNTVEPPSLLDDPLPAQGLDDPAARMMLQDLRSYLPDDILCKVDRAAMGIGLETRVPFLDLEVIRLAARLPLDMKIRQGTGKWLLRRVLERHVPTHLVDRPKAGFAVPVGRWLRGPLRDWAEALLAPDRLSTDGLLRADAVREAWADHLSGRRDNAAQLWNVLMFQSWHHHGT